MTRPSMGCSLSGRAALFLLAGFVWSGFAGAQGAGAPAYCLSPDATKEERALIRQIEALHKYVAEASWGETATDGVVTPGMPMTLTYSFIPDGTTIPGEEDLSPSDAPSDLFGDFDALFGSTAAWQSRFAQAFDGWSNVTGITFVFEPNDDGAPMPDTDESPGAPGALGVRGDIRIGGRTLDGAGGGVLAYNFYPPFGDMVIDTSDTAFYSNSSSGYLRLRNTVAHEIGHGIGLGHSCPGVQIKLMEPNITTAFDGPQFDDVLGGQRLYGDVFAGNGAFGSGALLGNAATGPVVLTSVSLRNDADLDYFRFSLSHGAAVDITVSPVGSVYQAGPQQENGDCFGGTNFNPATELDLRFRVLDAEGAEVAGAVDGSGLGASVSLAAVPLAAGTYSVEVSASGGGSRAQAYSLTMDGTGPSVVTIVPSPAPSLVEAGSGSTTLSMVVAGAAPPVSYAWYKVGSPTALADDGRISGSATATLRFTPPVTDDTGAYRLRVTDPTKGITESAPISLVVVENLPLRWGAVWIAAAFLGALSAAYGRWGASAFQRSRQIR